MVQQCSGNRSVRTSNGIIANACNGAASLDIIKDIGTEARDAAATAHATAATGCSSICSTTTAIATTENATAVTVSTNE